MHVARLRADEDWCCYAGSRSQRTCVPPGLCPRASPASSAVSRHDLTLGAVVAGRAAAARCCYLRAPARQSWHGPARCWISPLASHPDHLSITTPPQQRPARSTPCRRPACDADAAPVHRRTLRSASGSPVLAARRHRRCDAAAVARRGGFAATREPLRAVPCGTPRAASRRRALYARCRSAAGDILVSLDTNRTRPQIAGSGATQKRRARSWTVSATAAHWPHLTPPRSRSCQLGALEERIELHQRSDSLLVAPPRPNST